MEYIRISILNHVLRSYFKWVMVIIYIMENKMFYSNMCRLCTLIYNNNNSRTMHRVTMPLKYKLWWYMVATTFATLMQLIYKKNESVSVLYLKPICESCATKFYNYVEKTGIILNRHSKTWLTVNFLLSKILTFDFEGSNSKYE